VNLPRPFEIAGEHIAIDLPGARALFTTRRGGYSAGPYESLNLGLLTDDDPDSVARNRAVLTHETGVALAYIRQVHGTKVLEAIVERPGREADGEVTAERGVGTIVMTADCLPIAIAATEGSPGVGILHAGWRGLLAGIVAAGTRALGDRTLAAAIGPSIGPCCYEVGNEVAQPFREAFGDDVVREGKLDLWTSAERALRAAGVAHVDRFDVCTSCEHERFFSHRRDNGHTGRQGVIAYVA
jgi:purine-nucleoside/S-methyl-5'-thioadenosine phosphorylase / adenosine deaminase